VRNPDAVPADARGQMYGPFVPIILALATSSCEHQGDTMDTIRRHVLSGDDCRDGSGRA
jgi:hypothetical protein